MFWKNVITKQNRTNETQHDVKMKKKQTNKNKTKLQGRGQRKKN